jgi:hypothetical protein
MAEPETTKTSESSWIAWQLMHLSFEIGFIRATTGRTLAICEQTLTLIQVQPESRYPQFGIINRALRNYRRLQEYWEQFEKLRRLLTVVRAIRWGSLAWSAHTGLRWLGVI